MLVTQITTTCVNFSLHYCTLISLLLLCEGRHGLHYHKSFLPLRKVYECAPVDTWIIRIGSHVGLCWSFCTHPAAASGSSRICPWGVDTQLIHHSNSIITNIQFDIIKYNSTAMISTFTKHIVFQFVLTPSEMWLFNVIFIFEAIVCGGVVLECVILKCVFDVLHPWCM